METFFPEILDPQDKIRVTLTTAAFPFIDRNYAFALYKAMNSSIKIQVSCKNTTIISLGYPYDRFICTDRLSEYFDCIENCKQVKSTALLNLLPFSSFHSKPTKLRLMTNFVRFNRSSERIMENLHKECNRQCIKRSCRYSYCITRGRVGYPSQYDKLKSSVRINLADNPDSVIENLPQVKLLDCVIFILSTLGTWFGLVLVSCNPLMLYRKLCDKLCSHPNNNVIPIRHVKVTRVHHFRY